ncbi:MAG: glycosyl transferase family 2 [Cyanobacteria bacterium RYN_339]|nr:glycosyl transferase family 2 [Cyanobacteria bacterium RYN_339]
MKTTVVVVSWNTRELLLACLAALESHAPGVPVWVVDNASSDESAAAVAERFPAVRVIANVENVGFARANNQVLRQVTTSYAWLLNPDTEIRPGALEGLEAALDDHPNAAVAGSALFNPDESPQACSFPFPTPLGTWAEWLYLPAGLARRRDVLFKLAPRRTEGETDWVLGASLLVRKAAMEAVGLLDEGYFMYSEELDWCARFREAGWATRLALASEVVHHGGASTRQVPDQMLISLFRTRARFFRRHAPAWWFGPLMWVGAAWNAGYAKLRGIHAPTFAIARAISDTPPASGSLP